MLVISLQSNIFLRKGLYLLVFFFCSLISSISYGQKIEEHGIIDFDAIANWTKVSSDADISDDGKFVAYHIENEPKGSGTLVIKSVFGNDVKKFVGAKMGGFINNNNYRLIGKDNKPYSVNIHNGNLTLIINQKTKPQIKEAKDKVFAPILKRENGITSIYAGGTSIQKLGDDLLINEKAGMKIVSINSVSECGSIRLDLSNYSNFNISTDYQHDLNGVFVWSYTDRRLQSEQLFKPETQDFCLGIIVPGSNSITILEDETHSASRVGNSEYWIVDQTSERIKQGDHWGAGLPKKFEYIFNEANGQRNQLFLDSISPKRIVDISLDGTNLIYYNSSDGDYYSYNVISRVTTNLTKPVLSGGFSRQLGLGSSPHSIEKYGYYGIMKIGNNKMYVYDEYDIWKFDLSNLQKPVCITNGYGRKSGLVFRPLGSKSNNFNWNGKSLTSGFNPTTKETGVFAVNLNGKENPKQLLLVNGMCVRFDPNIPFPAIKKAKDANVLLYQLSSADKSPNWYVTDGTANFQISDVSPENGYNWLTSELVSWSTKDGANLQGVMYKPENFDPSKKYPVILNYYEILSDRLHEYHTPSLITADIDIPWFTSRGYIVFRPDVKYKEGHQGESALECIESGTEEIIKRSYIDKNRIGIAGHSWGGYETLFVVTHTKRYAAALAAASASNFTSLYNSLYSSSGRGKGSARQFEREYAQGGIPATMWERPDLYIENSPIFYADKVATPLLMMHNQNDPTAHPFSQSMEFFLAMHRLGKPVWLLEYENQRHYLEGSDDSSQKKDYTIRVTQFFDHYLKGSPAPLWMLEGISVNKKGDKSGIQLDTLGRTPGQSPNITAKEQLKINKYSDVPLKQKLKIIEKK